MYSFYSCNSLGNMKRVGLIFGGRGNEAEVSIASAKNIAQYLDYDRYSLVPIFWTKNAEFMLLSEIGNYMS